MPHTNRERAVFTHALREVPPDRWAEHLTEACGDDDALRGRVLALLQAHAEPDGAFGRTVDHVGDAAAPAVEAGTEIGPYKLLEKIGEGGMGVVFMAEQREPVRRRVALKLLRSGPAGGHATARFEAERQALALMDHQNIARVFDAGTSPRGDPFMAMELIHGVPITEFADAHRLTPRERLGLFVPVCRAVQHAHQNGVIHRDIKPNNVLVTQFDGRPVPKVIDFGVAKAVDQSLTDKTLFTRFGTVVGTFEYMSPEQAELNQLGVDTRSDVFSLGVLLYELLTGTTPLERGRLAGTAWQETLRLIKEEEPTRPSDRLGSSAGLPKLAASRGVAAGELPGLVRGELDWVVLKCLEKDRSRRYDGAGDLARDVERHLADEAVEACPPTAGYRLRKFARRHRRSLGTAAVVLAVMAAGTAVSVWQAVRASRQAEAARAAEARAAESAADTRAFSEFLVADVLAAARPKDERGGLGPGVTVRDALRRAAGNIDERFRGRPRAEALARQDLGVTFRLIGDLPRAERQLRQAARLRERHLGPAAHGTLQSRNSLAVVIAARGRLEEAAVLYARAAADCERALGPDHDLTLAVRCNLAGVYSKQGQSKRALVLHLDIFERRRRILGDSHPETLVSMGWVAGTYGEAGETGRALNWTERLLRLRADALGEDHPRTLNTAGNLAALHAEAGRLDEAIALAGRSLKALRKSNGASHPQTLKAMGMLADFHDRAGDFAAAEPLHKERYGHLRKRKGLDGEREQTSHMGLYFLWRRMSLRAEAQLRRHLLTTDPTAEPTWRDFFHMNALGAAMASRGAADAETYLTRGYRGLKARAADIPEQDRDCLAAAAGRLADFYRATGRPRLAESLLGE